MSHSPEFALSCPMPIRNYSTVQLAHGGGGRLMHDLIEQVFAPAFEGIQTKERHDSAVLVPPAGRLAFTTDSYVIRPLFFPGGDIGSLAVHGTVNDLAMSGARPLWIAVSFIIEEGLPMETLWRIVRSIRQAADVAGVQIVTGDTKVVDRGKGDGIFINTSGIGIIESSQEDISPAAVKPGDVVLVNHDLGRHGIAIMAVREGLEFETAIESDSAPLNGTVAALLASRTSIHCMRDLTRGGLASTLNEIAESAGVGIEIEEAAIPVREDVRGACEILGFDPLYVANEGAFALFVPPEHADQALAILRAQSDGATAARIGTVTADSPGLVTMKSRIGARRIVDMLSGEQLPRIC